MRGPEPLPGGTLLNSRYEVVRVLGQGSFGITYLARDTARGDSCAIKEMAPTACQRQPDGQLDFSGVGSTAAQRLRQQFLREAKTVRSLNIRGVPRVRDAFNENGTAYFVSDYIEGVRSLAALLTSNHQFRADAVEEFGRKACAILSPLHALSVLHRDIKPSNLLLTPAGEVVLIDFGAAREFHAGETQDRTVFFTPNYAPLEQLSERGRHGPATDLYGLCATLYHMLLGVAPPAATERVNGTPLDEDGLETVDAPNRLIQAIRSGLAVKFDQRPGTVAEWLDLLGGASFDDDALSLEELDRRAMLLRSLRPGKRACPACPGVLEQPKPLKVGQCFVCRRGTVRVRKIYQRLCPSCKTGYLRTLRFEGEPPYCPACQGGPLRRTGLLKKRWTCDTCAVAWIQTRDGIVKDGHDAVAPWSEWVIAAGRSAVLERCDSCSGQFDHLPDGRWRQCAPKVTRDGFHELYPDEWAMVASGYEPGQGNAECDQCGADYFVETGATTLLTAHEDPYHIGQMYQSVKLDPESMRWVGVGKTSGNAGLVCSLCPTEFDFEGDVLALVRSNHERLRRHVDAEFALEDWHRIAHGLPLVGNEAELDEAMRDRARAEYRSGLLQISSREDEALWRGPAVWENRTGTLLVGTTRLSLGGTLRKRRIELAELLSIGAKGDLLSFEERDGTVWDVTLTPIELTVRLQSGSLSIELRATDLAARIRAR